WKKESRSREVGLGPCKAGDETGCNGVAADCHHDGNSGGRLLRHASARRSVCNEDINIRRNKLCYKVREPIVVPLRPAKLNSNVRTLDVAEFAEARSE